MFAKMCREISRCIVSTDSPEIAEVARQHGAEVPFLRPAALAQDDSPIWPTLQHALASLEQTEGARYDYLLLLDPTSPAREPADVTEALRRLEQTSEADGVIGVSQPEFSPIWHCVIERDGWMANWHSDGARYVRRQDVPRVYRINGSLYVWRSAFVHRASDVTWRTCGRHMLHEIPESRAMSIDTEEQFTRAELLVTGGLIRLPWLSTIHV